MDDLSTAHKPVSDIFGDHVAPEACALTREQSAFFEENGYVAGIQALNDEQCDELCAELEAISTGSHPRQDLFYEFNSNESSDPGTLLFHALGAWRLSPGFHEILWHRPITVPASQLVGGPLRFWHDQLFCKPARHGGVVAWHQDYSYWTRTRPLAHLTCWIGLDESTTGNGCLYYVPGSHTWPLLPVTGLAGDMEAIYTVLDDEQKAAFNPVPVELKRGQCAFHHALMVHGSYANRSDCPRRAVVLNFVRDGVRSDSDEPLLAGVPPIPKGEPLEGQFFPLLYENGRNG